MKNTTLTTQTETAIVVGAGHAGCEAAFALARMGIRVTLLSLNLDAVAFLACNPSVGGTAKGHLVREIDALGGEMGRAADDTLIQLRMLNRSKGAAVQSLRAQVDKHAYHARMKAALENEKNITLRQGEVKELLFESGAEGSAKKRVTGVLLANGMEILAGAVILCCGVYLKSRIITGEYIAEQGPSGFCRASYLSGALEKAGFALRRFKTGTPARLHSGSIDYSKLTAQPGETDIYSFSVLSKKVNAQKAVCWLGFTNEKMHDFLRENLSEAPMYSSAIKGTGARYCPSIEDKIVRFADKSRHQFFLEPEALNSKEVYAQGLSTSMPARLQQKMYSLIDGLENVAIMRDAYAIEYDCIDPTVLTPALESREISGLYFAGQINGTSGYEEAAAQGLMAGINAALKLKDKPPFILKRSEAYIGVLIDDLTTKGTNEPYRMMTSRAEYRLVLRQDNADLRLTPYAAGLGLATSRRMRLYRTKAEGLAQARAELTARVEHAAAAAVLKADEEFFKAAAETEAEGIGRESDCNNSQPQKNSPLRERGGGAADGVFDLPPPTQSPPLPPLTLAALIKRTRLPASDFTRVYPCFKGICADAVFQIFVECRYEGYLKQQERAISEFNRLEEKQIPAGFDYDAVRGLRIEARQKLSRLRPLTVGQASRISGVSPADINVLIMSLR